MSRETLTGDTNRQPVSTHEDGNRDESTAAAVTIPGIGRRPVLKTLGISTALLLGSGHTAAAEEDSAQIDPRYGYVAAATDEIPARLQPAHEVQLLVEPPDPETGTPPSFFFEPTGLHVSSGDIVQFTFTTPDHTVTAYHPATGFQQRVPENVPPFSSPSVNGGGAWLYRFDQPGVYDVYCGPHHAFGMVGRIVVGDLTEEAIPEYEATFEGAEDPPLLAPYSREMLEEELTAFSDRNANAEWVWLTPQEVLDTDALDPMQIQSAGTVSFSDVRTELDRGGM